MQAGDIMRIIDEQQIQSQKVQNVYYYSVGTVAGAPTLQDISDEFETQVINVLDDVQSDTLEHVTVFVDNLNSTVEFEEFAINSFGAQVSEPLPSFAAMTVRLNRTTKLTRNGSKRIAGITENLVLNGVLSLPGANRDAIEAALEMVLLAGTSPNDVDLTPVIIPRLAGGGLDLLNPNVVKSATVVNISTQNSRKLGRGE